VVSCNAGSKERSFVDVVSSSRRTSARRRVLVQCLRAAAEHAAAGCARWCVANPGVQQQTLVDCATYVHLGFATVW
jgi:hypothetical protein